MKRYRMLYTSYDSRAEVLKLNMEEISPEYKTMWEDNIAAVRLDLQMQFGSNNYDQKEQDLIAIGSMPFAIIAFHTKLLRQIRNSFVAGCYYPALTGVTTLTERILNHLILELREDYVHTRQYRKVRSSASISNWNLMIPLLINWGVLLPEIEPQLRTLQSLRHNYAVHFNRETEKNDRELALQAIINFQEFIQKQFGHNVGQPWFIEGSFSEPYIKKEWESNPFIRKIYLPYCVLVGPNYKLNYQNGIFIPEDVEYDEKSITDEEFMVLRHKFCS